MQQPPVRPGQSGTPTITATSQNAPRNSAEIVEADGLPPIERETPLPAGLRRLMYALGIGCLFLGIAAVREPKQSTASPLHSPIAMPSARAIQNNVIAAEATLVGGLRSEFHDVSIYATPSNQPLFVIKDKRGRLLANMISAGELSARFPALSLDDLLAGIRLDSNPEQRQLDAADPSR